MEKKTLIIIAAAAIILIVLALALGLAYTPPDEPSYDFLDSTECPKDYGSRPLLVVCLDGFRPDYLKRGQTPTLRKLAEAGVEAEHMIPSYPSVTFPNHYTIVTGLYPEAHGIIGNNFYDPVFKTKFTLWGSLKNEGRWWGGEPIWNTLTRHDKKSATYFWPGSEADIGGIQPTHWLKYNKNKSFDERVQKVIEWITLPLEERPQWISLYFNEPDSKGHTEGPEADSVDKQLAEMDGYIRMLLDDLAFRGIHNCINIMIVSDHGMAQAGKEKVIDVDDYVQDLTEQAYFYGGASGKITLKNYSREDEFDIMRQLSCKRDEMRVYTPKGLPKRLHFANNRRIEDIITDLDAGYTMAQDKSRALEGVHGYDNIFPEMNALFLAYGPDFHRGLKIEPFQNIELYNLMCHLTGVSPAENNGTWGSLNHLIVNPPSIPESKEPERPPVLRYPKDNLEERLDASGCARDEPTPEQWKPSLNLTETQEAEIESYHAPWGIPYSDSLAADTHLLYHPDHITGFSNKAKIPLWTSFTFRPDQLDGVQLLQHDSSWTSDARLQAETTPSCASHDVLQRLNFSMVPLFPPAFSTNHSQIGETAFLISNAIPLSKDIKDQWEGLLGTLVQSWLVSQGPLNILLGPVFDYNSDSYPDDFASFSNKPLVPTDLYAVLTRCQDQVARMDKCLDHSLDSIAFIFHQNQPISNCLSLEEFALKFSSTVKDVEHVTGLSFFSKLAFQPRVQQILKLHPQLWPNEKM